MSTAPAGDGGQCRPSEPEEARRSGRGSQRLTPAAAYAHWATLADLIHPGLTADPDWPALAAALNRAAAAGYDAAAMLPGLAADPLPERDPGRELHHRLVVACPGLTSPVREGTEGPAEGGTSDPVETSPPQPDPEAPPQQPETATESSR
jgi:hypothetical protein